MSKKNESSRFWDPCTYPLLIEVNDHVGVVNISMHILLHVMLFQMIHTVAFRMVFIQARCCMTNRILETTVFCLSRKRKRRRNDLTTFSMCMV